ncbi:MAG: hypothetical protein K8I82_22475 [Anaerolineae bacterium]|nr:hypothetical protein [Anaerolineae bacterium]
MKRLLIILSLLLVLVPVISAQEGIETLSVEEVERSYYLHLPDNYDSADSLPLIVALHPAASSGKAMAALTGLDSAEGFIVAYPNAVGVAWQDGRASQTGQTDDVGYITTLIDSLVESHKVDAEQVYLVGWGGGGLMAYRLACEVPERFAGVAVVGALMWEEHRDNCAETDLAAATRLLILHGTEDVFYSSESGMYISPGGSDGIPLLGIVDTLAVFAERNECADELVQEGAIFQYTDCGLGAVDMPGMKQNWPRTGDYAVNPSEFNASDLLLQFFTGSEDWAAEPPEFDGLARNYTVYVPNTYDPAQPTPLVLALHGRLQSIGSLANTTDWNVLAEEEQFIVLYPEGIDMQWNYLRDILGYPYDEHDDAQFFADLISDLSRDLNIDSQRIYVSGFSNGGFMVHRLACEASDQYAAFADVAGSGFEGFERVCPPRLSVHILIMHGTEDYNIPWEGRQQNLDGYMIYVTVPISGLFTFWREQVGCGQDYETEDLPQLGSSPGTSVRMIRLTDCPNGEELLLYGIIGGGHNWPGYPDRLPPEIAGPVNQDIDATRVIWEFFSRHTLNN